MRRLGLAVLVTLGILAAAQAQAPQRVNLPLVVRPPGASVPTQTATATASPTATQTPVPVTLWANGDFEQGDTGWLNGHLITTTVSLPVTPHSGTHVARLTMQPPPFGTPSLERMITVPDGTPYLHYWVWVRSTEPTCGDDQFEIDVFSQNHPPAAPDTVTLCATTQTDAWQARVVDLSAYAGEAVHIAFVAASFDDLTDSSIYLDDVGWQPAP